MGPVLDCSSENLHLLLQESGSSLFWEHFSPVENLGGSGQTPGLQQAPGESEPLYWCRQVLLPLCPLCPGSSPPSLATLTHTCLQLTSRV